MNQDQVLGIFRTLIGIGSGYAVGNGWLTGEQVTLIGGAAGAIVPLIWSFFAHTDSAKIAAAAALPGDAKLAAFSGIPASAKIAAVAALPDVKKIVTKEFPIDPAVAAAASDPSQTKVAPAP